MIQIKSSALGYICARELIILLALQMLRCDLVGFGTFGVSIFFVPLPGII